MPKKRSKNEDFKKKKLKLGQKSVASNQTNLSFKAKSINVPTQGLVNDYENVKKDLLQSTLSQLSNTSRSARLESLRQLLDYFNDAESEINLNLGDVLRAVIPVLLDKSAEVRKRLQELVCTITATCDEALWAVSKIQVRAKDGKLMQSRVKTQSVVLRSLEQLLYVPPALQTEGASIKARIVRYEKVFPMLPVLIEVWLDFAPRVFDPGQKPDALVFELLVRILNVFSMVFNCAEISSIKKDARLKGFMENLSSSVLSKFPREYNAQQNEISKLFTASNLTVCDIVLTLDSHAHPINGTMKYLDYLKNMLNKAPSLSDEEADRLIQLCLRLTRTEGVWNDGILESLGNAFSIIPVQSRIWPSLFYTIQTSITTRSESTLLDSLFKSWLLILPKALWVLGKSNLALTEDILHAILACLKENVCGLSIRHPDLLGKIADTFVPFFSVNVKGKGQNFGPFLSLPSNLQTLALHILSFVPAWSLKLTSGVANCSYASHSTVVFQMLEVFSHAQAINTIMSWESYLSLLFSIGIFGHAKNELGSSEGSGNAKNDLMAERCSLSFCKSSVKPFQRVLQSIQMTGVDCFTAYSIFQGLLRDVMSHPDLTDVFMRITYFLEGLIEMGGNSLAADIQNDLGEALLEYMLIVVEESSDDHQLPGCLLSPLHGVRVAAARFLPIADRAKSLKLSDLN
ncbi:hypothetical protein HDU67_007986 [Dinochytrium kinnereticum]|nr:hypothetical protein HDU67_007986 [Dinochytrium kinnereticum]